jgi:phage shock protein A
MTNIASRVSRLISGSVNAAIDAVENMSPDMVMEQSIREVEGAIAEVRAELGRATAERHLAAKKLADNSSKHEDLAAQIEVAVGEGREDLASAAISRQMDLEAQVPVLEQTVSDAAEREKELEGYIDALKGKRAEMQEELKAFKARRAEQPENTVIDAAGNPSAAHDINQKVDRAAAAFDRASGHAADMLGASADDAAKMAELKDLARKSEIEKRLAAMKAKSA